MRPNRNSQLRWLETDGGPFILLPKSHTIRWNGARFGLGTDRTDYDRACAPEDYLAKLLVGDAEALILGDDAFETAWWPQPIHGGGILVRWLWARDESDVIQTLRRLDEDVWVPEDITFEAQDGDLLLFDAACSGDSMGRRISVRLSPGRHAISTANVEPNPETCLLLHRLLPLQ